VHYHLPSSHDLIFSPSILKFLWDLFGEAPVAFQGLYFEYGSAQGAHNDTAFVYVEPASLFAASWIALEDIKPNTGELFYYPGDMIHVDTKQLACFQRVGHRITGDRRQGCSPGAGYEKVHVAVDDATRLAYVEVLPDEQQSTTVGFLVRAVGWFSEQGMTCRRILSDNGSAYRSGAWRKACRTMAIKPIRTKPYTPQTNGKAERFIKTLLNEGAYAMPFQTSNERNRWLPRYLGLYNSRRSNMAQG
jgi:hypothetical protein